MWKGKMHVTQTSSGFVFRLFHTYSCSAYGADPEYHFPSLRRPSFAEKTSKYWEGLKKRLFCSCSKHPRRFVSFYPRESSLVLFNSPFKTDLSQAVFKSSKTKTDSLARLKTLKVKTRDPPLANLSPLSAWELEPSFTRQKMHRYTSFKMT